MYYFIIIITVLIDVLTIFLFVYHGHMEYGPCVCNKDILLLLLLLLLLLQTYGISQQAP